ARPRATPSRQHCCPSPRANQYGPKTRSEWKQRVRPLDLNQRYAHVTSRFEAIVMFCYARLANRAGTSVSLRMVLGFIQIQFSDNTAFFGTDANAEVAGDVAMLSNEVTPVLKALRANGLNVVAIHNHMTSGEPTIYFLHYWGTGPIEKFAGG